MRNIFLLFVFSALIVVGCKTANSFHSQDLNSAKLKQIDEAITTAIAQRKLPGAIFSLEHNRSTYRHAYGQRSIIPTQEPTTEDTIFDLASLTKVVATTPAIMLLIERRKIALDEPVKTYLPQFKGSNRDAITIRHLLTHTSGLRPGIGSGSWVGYRKGIELACAEKPTTFPGTSFRYSDINFILLGEIVRQVGGSTLDVFVETEIYRPLKMVDTGFLPSLSKLLRIAPTEKQGDGILRGVVHDPTSRQMGGVAGHAGLFSTISDLSRFVRMILNDGAYEDVRIFQPQTIKLMSSIQSPDGITARRGLGWDIDSGYSRPRGKIFPLGSFGHTGWTGTAMWIDPFSRTFWILLSNRVHPDGKGNVLELQANLGTLAAEAISDFNFDQVPGALKPLPKSDVPQKNLPKSAQTHTNLPPTIEVYNGIDVLVKENFSSLKGLRMGLVTNHTGKDKRRRSTIDLLKAAPGAELKVLFSPEHGIRGDVDDKVNDSVDEKTGLPVYSLYGANRRPQPAQLKDLNALVFDIQDIGCRFYTYISTLRLAMEAASEAHIKMVVLDRVNPINGNDVAGPVYLGEFSFTACHALPVRHAMTVGELALMLNTECHLKVDLKVIPVEGWKRNMLYDETGLPWINPSPNMRSLTEAILYPGVGLLETTPLSVGRGTDTPFEVIGAPYIDDLQLGLTMNRMGLPGVRFIPVQFTPKSSVFQDKVCQGVNIVIVNREQFQPVLTGLVLAQTLHKLYPKHFDLEKFDRLLVHPPTVALIKAGKTMEDIFLNWEPELNRFQQRRKKYLLYY